MANIDDTGTTQPITDVPITTEPTTVTTSTEPSAATDTSPGTAAPADNANGKEKFDYEEVKKAMEALDGEFKKFAETLKKANDLMNENINVSCESAIYSKSGDGVGAKFLKQWNDNASTFGDFYNNFEGWSKLVTLISSNNAEFEVTARTTGGTMDGVSSLVAGALAAVPTEPSGTGIDEVDVFLINHGLINYGAAWMTAFMALAPESQSKLNRMIQNATEEAEKYIGDYGLVNNGTAYNNLDKAAKDIVDKRIKENEENSTDGLTNPPTGASTNPPTGVPTNPPTGVPTNPPTSAPTNPPTGVPTNPPTSAPTNPPTSAPTEAPVTAAVLTSGDIVNIDGKLHKYYGTCSDSSGKPINIYVDMDGRMLYEKNDSLNYIYSAFDESEIQLLSGVQDCSYGNGSFYIDGKLVWLSSVSSSVVYENPSGVPVPTGNSGNINPYHGTNYQSTYNVYDNAPSLLNASSGDIVNGNRVAVPTSLVSMQQYMNEGYEIIRIDPGSNINFKTGFSGFDPKNAYGNEPIYLKATGNGNYKIVDQYGNFIIDYEKGANNVYRVDSFK